MTASVLTGCAGASTLGTFAAATENDGLPPSASAAQNGAKTACELITPAVLEAARFPDRVFRQTKRDGVGKNGASACSYGDDPDPANISPSYLALLILPPSALRATHTTAVAQVKATGYPCSPAQLATFGPDEAFGGRAYFCTQRGHAPDGGWVRGNDAYLVEVGFPDVEYGTPGERASYFESVARAIDRNVDG